MKFKYAVWGLRSETSEDAIGIPIIVVRTCGRQRKEEGREAGSFAFYPIDPSVRVRISWLSHCKILRLSSSEVLSDSTRHQALTRHLATTQSSNFEIRMRWCFHMRYRENGHKTACFSPSFIRWRLRIRFCFYECLCIFIEVSNKKLKKLN